MKKNPFGFVVGVALLLAGTVIADETPAAAQPDQQNASVASEAVKNFSYQPAAKTPGSPALPSVASTLRAPVNPPRHSASPVLSKSGVNAVAEDEALQQIAEQPLQMATYHVKEMPDRTFANLNHALLVEKYLEKPSLYAVNLTRTARFEFMRPPEPVFSTEPGTPANNASGSPTARFPILNFTW